MKINSAPTLFSIGLNGKALDGVAMTRVVHTVRMGWVYVRRRFLEVERMVRGLRKASAWAVLGQTEIP